MAAGDQGDPNVKRILLIKELIRIIYLIPNNTHLADLRVGPEPGGAVTFLPEQGDEPGGGPGAGVAAGGESGGPGGGPGAVGQRGPGLGGW